MNASSSTPMEPAFGSESNITNETTEVDEDEYYEYSDRSLYLNNVRVNCWKYIAPGLLVIGTVGNLLSILVLRR